MDGYVRWNRETKSEEMEEKGGALVRPCKRRAAPLRRAISDYYANKRNVSKTVRYRVTFYLEWLLISMEIARAFRQTSVRY